MSNPAADFPTAIHTAPDITSFSSTPLGGSIPTHTQVEGKQEQELIAIQTKIGLGSATPSLGDVLYGTGTGESNWSNLITLITPLVTSLISSAISGLFPGLITVSEELLNGSTYAFPETKSGFAWLQIGDNQEWVRFNFKADGTADIIESSGLNVITTDTNGFFCILDGGAGVLVKNRLGSTLSLKGLICYA